MIERFEDFIVWKKAMRLAVEIYMNLKDCKDFGFRDQIQRAGVSV
ncbi:MAG TPA: four helix bundle protein, partial [Candidatus Cloacimonetes bacterium]|nr:four helix bundle protein [Candidatus Cloacimonadota bacterium]